MDQNYQNKITMVILEDDNIYAESIELLVNSTNDITCIKIFSNISDFIQEFKNYTPDIYWIDINLVDGSGSDMIYNIKKYNPSALSLVCSFCDDDDTVFKAISNGADGYLLKGESNKKILNSIRELYMGGAPMSSVIAQKILTAFRTEITPDSNKLTPRESQILEELSKGLKYKEIALHFNISYETVKKHIQNIYQKLEVTNKTEAIIRHLYSK